MNTLEKTKQIMESRLALAAVLQKYRNADFPKNSLSISKNNLFFLMDYFQNTMCNSKYRFTLDTIIVTHVINYLDSVKGYLNRKKRTIQKKPQCIYKNDILQIIEKYWSKNHAVITDVDYLIKIRDCFEHDEIDGLQFRISFDKDKITYSLLHNDKDFIQLCINAFRTLEKMNEEIKSFIEIKINECNIRECILFKLAFSKRFNDGYECALFPEPTTEEINLYDNLIENLYKESC